MVVERANPWRLHPSGERVQAPKIVVLTTSRRNIRSRNKFEVVVLDIFETVAAWHLSLEM